MNDLTATERLELRALTAEVRALTAEVRVAELTLQIAQAAQHERACQIAAAHGLDPLRPFTLTPDGRLTQDAEGPKGLTP